MTNTNSSALMIVYTYNQNVNTSPILFQAINGIHNQLYMDKQTLDPKSGCFLSLRSHSDFLEYYYAELFCLFTVNCDGIYYFYLLLRNALCIQGALVTEIVRYSPVRSILVRKVGTTFPLPFVVLATFLNVSFYYIQFFNAACIEFFQTDKVHFVIPKVQL